MVDASLSILKIFLIFYSILGPVPGTGNIKINKAQFLSSPGRHRFARKMLMNWLSHSPDILGFLRKHPYWTYWISGKLHPNIGNPSDPGSVYIP